MFADLVMVVALGASPFHSIAAPPHQKNAEAESPPKATNYKCPVHGRVVNPKVPPVSVRGHSYGLCCPCCGPKLNANPDKYLNKDGTPKNEAPAEKPNTAPRQHEH